MNLEQLMSRPSF